MYLWLCGKQRFLKVGHKKAPTMKEKINKLDY